MPGHDAAWSRSARSEARALRRVGRRRGRRPRLPALRLGPVAAGLRAAGGRAARRPARAPSCAGRRDVALVCTGPVLVSQAMAAGRARRRRRASSRCRGCATSTATGSSAVAGGAPVVVPRQPLRRGGQGDAVRARARARPRARLRASTASPRAASNDEVLRAHGLDAELARSPRRGAAAMRVPLLGHRRHAADHRARRHLRARGGLRGGARGADRPRDDAHRRPHRRRDRHACCAESRGRGDEATVAALLDAYERLLPERLGWRQGERAARTSSRTSTRSRRATTWSTCC